MIGIDEVLSHHLPQRRIIVDDQDMAYFGQVIVRAVVIPTSGSGRGRGPLSEGSAKELRVVQETAIEATYFPPHS